jgi:hypothetical protein
MNTYGEIIGVRILIRIPNSDKYDISYEFKDDNWKQKSLNILSQYIDFNDIKIQTLHSFSTSYHLQTGQIQKPGNIWLDNSYFIIDNLYIY